MAVVQKKYVVEYIDAGMQGALSNRGILRMLEDIACYHGDIYGLSARNMQKTKLTWILMGWHVEVYERAKLLDEVIVKTWSTGSVKNIYSFRDFILENSEGKILARASSKWILYNFEKKMPIRNMDEYTEKFGVEENYAFDVQDITNMKEIPSEEIAFTYTVLKKDIDINLHLHNTNYLDISEETLPLDVYKNNTFNKFNIVYKKQFLYGEKINCTLKINNTTEDSSYNISLKDENNITHAYVKLYN